MEGPIARDAVDRRILHARQEIGRATCDARARQVGLSASAVQAWPEVVEGSGLTGQGCRPCRSSVDFAQQLEGGFVAQQQQGGNIGHVVG